MLMILSYMRFAHRPKVLTSRCVFLAVLMTEVATWMLSNRLQLNANKTEFIWLSSSRRVHQISQQPRRVGVGLSRTSLRRSKPRHLFKFRHVYEVSRCC